jgi:hypothetical protein
MEGFEDVTLDPSISPVVHKLPPIYHQAIMM